MVLYAGNLSTIYGMSMQKIHSTQFRSRQEKLKRVSVPCNPTKTKPCKKSQKINTTK